MKKVCVVNDDNLSISRMFRDRGYKVISISSDLITNKLTVENRTNIQNQIKIIEDKAELVVFCGGTDINPMIYGRDRHRLTDSPDLIRDMFEIQVFKAARKLSLPLVGICRGAQLLNVLSGGLLLQNSDLHHYSHPILLLNKDEESVLRMPASANHHQVMLPGPDARTIAVQENTLDSEILYYPHSLSLCHQPHPEWEYPNSEYQNYFFKHIKQLINKEHIHYESK